MSQAMRKLTGIVSQSGTIIIFINQIREKVGIMFGNPETTPGGRALKFYSSQRIEVRRGSMVKNSDDVEAKIKVVKNKVAPPFRTTELRIRFGIGIDLMEDLVDTGLKIGCLSQKGAWISYLDKKWNGKSKFVDELYENKQLYEEVKQYIKDNLVGL